MSEPTTPDAGLGQDALTALSPEARAQWELTGEWPETAPATPAADPEADEHDESETVPPADPAPPVAAKSEPTPEKPVSKRQQHINELERKAKTAELRAEELAAKIAALEARTPEPVATKEPVKPQPVVDPNDPEPVEASFEDYGTFLRALAKWEIRQDRREAEAATQRTAAETRAREAQTARQTQISTWVARRDAFIAKEPTFQTHAMPFLADVTPGTPLGDVLMDSPVGPELALYLATHPEDVTRIGALHPIQQIRELGKLEAKFDDPSPTRTSASAGPAAKTVTTAPAPPTTLAARSADPSDPVAAAVARGDFSAFEAEENRKALAAAR